MAACSAASSTVGASASTKAALRGILLAAAGVEGGSVVVFEGSPSSMNN